VAHFHGSNGTQCHLFCKFSKETFGTPVTVATYLASKLFISLLAQLVELIV